MGTIFNLCGLLCIIALLGHWRFDRHLLDDKITNDQKLNNPISNQQTIQKNKQLDPNQLLHIASSQIGIREATGKNDGPQVEKYLSYTGNKKGEPWCASFVSWVFGQAGFEQPRTAWSPSLFPKAKLVPLGTPATVFGIYFPDKRRIAHAGIVEKQKHNWLYTIEGNTNIEGSREGDGVYRKMRHIKTIKYYADWTNMEGGKK